MVGGGTFAPQASGDGVTGVGLRERQLAQIVRDFIEVCIGAGRIGEALERGTLDFEQVERLIGDAEHHVLYRLKESCHSLFRLETSQPPEDVQAEQLFDLGVGALFHEAMKFREGVYLTLHYGPRLERIMAEGRAGGPAAKTFAKVIDAGIKRTRESSRESVELVRETCEQLQLVLRQRGGSGEVARSLVEHPRRTEAVFDMPLDELLGVVYGDAERGYSLAVEDLLLSGHFEQAGEVLGRSEVRDWPASRPLASFAAGMAAYYDGDSAEAVKHLGAWIDDGAPGPVERTRQVRGVLRAIARRPRSEAPRTAWTADALVARLKPTPRA